MAYVKPTTVQFKTRFPEFGPVNDARLSLVIDEVAPRVGETWVEDDRAPAIMYLVAHKLTMEGEPGRSTSLAAGGTGVDLGPMKRRKVGDVEVEYQNANERFGTGIGSLIGKSGFELSVYGREYLSYQRRNFSAVAVV